MQIKGSIPRPKRQARRRSAVKTLFLILFLRTASARAGVILDAAAMNRALSPGMNYGAIFDAKPPEGWGWVAKEGDFKVIAEGGFRGLRLPIRWDAEAGSGAPYTIDPRFFARIDRMLAAALGAGLTVVLDFHNFDGLMADPEGQKARFLGLWDQIAHHYRSYPRTVLFEVLNEPHDRLTPELWNALLPQALAVIRRENPDRVVLIGTADWGGIQALDSLHLPTGDSNLILSFHDYSPFHFTHQGATWVGPQSQAWVGTRWIGSFSETEELRGDFERVDAYARAHGVPVNLGEYGSSDAADEASRVLWTSAMSRAARRFDFSYFYWEFKAGTMAVYDGNAGKWRAGLKDAILP
jgi:endoglucanase